MNKTEAKALFSKYIDGTCTEQEIELLETYLDSYQSKNGKSRLSDFTDIEQSKDKIWQSICMELQHSRSKRKKYPFKKYLLYPAAAAILVLFGITIFFQNQGSKLPETQIVETNIPTGTDKATLTLSTGKLISLKKGNLYKSDNIESDGESLVYKKEEEKDVKDNKVAYNYLTVPRGGQFFVKLSDGTKVWLNSESKLKYPESFNDGEPRLVELVYGEAYFEVSPSTQHKGSKFNVLSEGQKIQVLGTQFNVKAYRDEKSTYTTLVEGKIELQANNQKKLLTPNLQAIVNENSKTITVKVVDVYNETSWKEGVFSFKSKSLKELMQVLSRWYDVEVVFENKSLEEIKFKGVLGKDQSLDDILLAIKSGSLINSYEIRNRTILIR